MLCKCCSFLANGIEFRYNAIALCSRVSHKGGGDIVVKYYDDKNAKDFKFDINEYILKRNEIIDANSGSTVYKQCEGCMELLHPEIKDINELKLSHIVLHHWTKCNSNCIYCYTNQNKQYYNKRKSYKVYPILKMLKKNGHIGYGGIVNYAGGEISCLKEFGKISKFFDKLEYSAIFNSSGIKYEKTVEKHLKNNSGMLFISIDAGKKETHKRIKQTDSYDKVWKNLKKYRQHCDNDEQLYVKYIVLPDINDTEEEINLFLEKVKESKIENVIFDIDIYYLNDNREKIPKNLIEKYEYALKRAKELELKFFLYNNASVMLTQGQWQNEKWKKYIFDDIKKTKVFKKQTRK